MKVADVMTRGADTCVSTDTLSEAARVMRDRDRGALPVVDRQGRAVGMITDRDICIAAYTTGEPLGNLSIANCASRGLVSVLDSDSLAVVEALMRQHQIRRIVVVDLTGRPVGMVTMNDLARNTRRRGDQSELSAEAIVRTLAAVSQPYPTVALPAS